MGDPVTLYSFEVFSYTQRGRQGSRSVSRAGAPLQPLPRLHDKKPLACIAWLALYSSHDCCPPAPQGRRGVGCDPAVRLARPGHWGPQHCSRGVPPVPARGACSRPHRGGSG